jgi:tellurite resistance protein TehA-like permease
MSKGFRIVIAIFALLGFTCFSPIGVLALTMEDPNYLQGLGFFGMGCFWLTVAILCLFPRTRPVTLRIIGFVILALCIAFLMTGPSGEDLYRAIGALIIFGLPSAWILVTGKYPLWGADAEAFSQNRPRDDK